MNQAKRLRKQATKAARHHARNTTDRTAYLESEYYHHRSQYQSFHQAALKNAAYCRRRAASADRERAEIQARLDENPNAPGWKRVWNRERSGQWRTQATHNLESAGELRRTFSSVSKP